MKRWTIAFIFLALCMIIVLRGGTDVEKQALIVTMGFDRDETGNLQMSLQVPSAGGGAGGTSEGGSNEGGGGSSGYEFIECTASSFVDALAILDAVLPLEINFSQMIQIVVSESLAQSPYFTDVLEELLTAPFLRQSASLIICRGKAGDFVKEQKPFLTARLSTSINNSLDEYVSMGNIPNSNMGEIIRLFNGAWRDAITPYAAVIKEFPPEKAEDGKPLDTQPGTLPHEGTSKIEYLGAAVFKDGRMVGTLTGQEMHFMYFLQGDMKEFPFLVGDRYYRMSQSIMPRVSVDTSTDPWTLHVDGSVKASPLRRGDGDLSGVREAFRKELYDLLKKLQSLGVDPVGFQGKAVRGSLTVRDWLASDWDQQYQRADIDISTMVSIGETR